MNTTIEKRFIELKKELDRTKGLCTIAWNNEVTGEVTPYQNRHILSIQLFPDRVEVEEEQGRRTMKSGKKGYQFKSPELMLDAIIFQDKGGIEIFRLKQD